MKDYRPELAEFLGTFALVFAGCGALAMRNAGFFVDPFSVAVAFGFTILIMVYAVGHISGAHFNPAVTLGFAAGGHFPARRVPTYLAAQVAGATAAAGLLRLAFTETGISQAVTRPAETYLGAAILFEVAFTFLLMFVIQAVATDERSAPAAAGLAIGGTVLVGALVAGPVSGGSFNPARSLGPAIAAGDFANLLLYMTAPVAGALLATLTYALVRGGSLTPMRYKDTPLGVLGPVPALREEAEEDGEVPAEAV